MKTFDVYVMLLVTAAMLSGCVITSGEFEEYRMGMAKEIEALNEKCDMNEGRVRGIVENTIATMVDDGSSTLNSTFTAYVNGLVKQIRDKLVTTAENVESITRRYNEDIPKISTSLSESRTAITELGNRLNTEVDISRRRDEENYTELLIEDLESQITALEVMSSRAEATIRALDGQINSLNQQIAGLRNRHSSESDENEDGNDEEEASAGQEESG